MSESHSHSISINPKELSAGSVLVSAEVNSNAAPYIATNRAEVSTKDHDGQPNAALAPIELVLTGLAMSTLQTLKMMAATQKLGVQKFFVAISQQRNGNISHIVREIIIEGHASDEERDLLKNAANNCPVTKFLGGQHQLESVIA